MNLNNIPFNWFDALILLMMLLGIARGRKRGLSQELFTMLLWVVLVLGCAVAYMPLGDLLASAIGFSSLTCYVICYLAVAALLSVLFAPIKRALGAKMITADSFGRAEYYVGMPVGMIRFLCILIAMLAILNARLYSTKEIVSRQAYQKEVYGSDFFPGLNSLQQDVFERSFTGPHIKKYLSFLLIKPTAPQQMQPLRRPEEKY